LIIFLLLLSSHSSPLSSFFFFFFFSLLSYLLFSEQESQPIPFSRLDLYGEEQTSFLRMLLPSLPIHPPFPHKLELHLRDEDQPHSQLWLTIWCHHSPLDVLHLFSQPDEGVVLMTIQVQSSASTIERGIMKGEWAQLLFYLSSQAVLVVLTSQKTLNNSVKQECENAVRSIHPKAEVYFFPVQPSFFDTSWSALRSRVIQPQPQTTTQPQEDGFS